MNSSTKLFRVGNGKFFLNTLNNLIFPVFRSRIQLEEILKDFNCTQKRDDPGGFLMLRIIR